MKSLREQLRDIEDYSYRMSVQMVGHVVDNYQRVTGRLIKRNDEVDKRLNEIIEKLTLHEEFNNMTYVGKQYSKADLVDELRAILELKK